MVRVHLTPKLILERCVGFCSMLLQRLLNLPTFERRGAARTAHSPMSYMLGEYDFSEQTLPGTLGILPRKRQHKLMQNRRAQHE